MSKDKSERIKILEAIIWVQEHHNQVMYLSDISADSNDYRNHLMEQYGFDYVQAQAIVDMRSKAFTMKYREEAKEELMELLGGVQ